MKVEILGFYHNAVNWFVFDTPFFAIWVATEKWWSDGNEHAVGIRFGSKIFEKRWG